MNDNQRAELRAQILKRLEDIDRENALGLAGQATVELDQQAVGRLSRMDALQYQAMAKAQATRRQGETSRLRAALTRMDAGEYGYCEECGEDIAMGRLELDPAAALCISCATG